MFALYVVVCNLHLLTCQPPMMISKPMSTHKDCVKLEKDIAANIVYIKPKDMAIRYIFSCPVQA
jgi:hypothetical protein